MKNNAVKFVVGFIVLIVTLLLFDRYIEGFDLFPSQSRIEQKPEKEEVVENQKEEETHTLEEAEPDNTEEIITDETDVRNRSYDDEEEASKGGSEATGGPKPKAKANKEIGYATPLKVSKGYNLVAGGVFDRSKSTTTTAINKIFCPDLIKSHRSKIVLQFSFATNEEESMAEDVFLLAIVSGKKKYLYKPHPKRTNINRNDNKLVFRNDFGAGEHAIKFGYILKKDVDKKEVPFYSKSCTISIK